MAEPQTASCNSMQTPSNRHQRERRSSGDAKKRMMPDNRVTPSAIRTTEGHQTLHRAYSIKARPPQRYSQYQFGLTACREMGHSGAKRATANIALVNPLFLSRPVPQEPSHLRHVLSSILSSLEQSLTCSQGTRLPKSVVFPANNRSWLYRVNA